MFTFVLQTEATTRDVHSNPNLTSGSFYASIERSPPRLPPLYRGTIHTVPQYHTRVRIAMASPYLMSEEILQDLESSWGGCDAMQAVGAHPSHLSAALIAQVAARPAGPVPNHTTTKQVSQSQPTGLRLLQLEEWEDGRLYIEDPPSSIYYTIEWEVTYSEKNKKNKKVVSRDTELDVVLALAAYWTRILQPKVKRLLRKKIGLEGRPRPEETVVMMLVNDRAERKLTKQF
jgi:hypothetical protein